jgi:hypothetical protein
MATVTEETGVLQKTMKLQRLIPKTFVAIFSPNSIARAGAWLALFIAIFGPMPARAGEMRVLHGHVPPATALSQPLGLLPGTNLLRLAISLPLRNQAALSNFLQRLYDPASPDYHHYLTPGQFTEKFGPTKQDYQRVIDFARSNGFEVVATRDSRMLLDIRAKVSDVERAFHVTLRSYQHPSEDRQFYAPDAEPTVDADLPILDIVGLGDYAVPRPMLHATPMKTKSASPTGSGPGGLFMGHDFRNAYAPGVNLNGAGQSVGLLELDGYKSSDITAYETTAGLPSVPLVNIDVFDYRGSIGAGQGEVTLDIAMAIAMAPGLSAVYVFQAGGGNFNTLADFQDILDSMAASNSIKQFSSSWSYTGTPDPNTTMDGYLQKMATQGQSFYQASGDGDAWINPVNVPADSPYLMSVGGTYLTMNGTGASYAAEAVWNNGNLGPGNGFSANTNTGSVSTENDYFGSGGGVSTVYSIPTWQTNAINSTNQGSATMRDIPDVALTGTNIFLVISGKDYEVSGTSCAAPLWAGFTALVNQQAAGGGSATVGFINPAIYALGHGSSYSSAFHDITTGNNSNLYSTNLFLAVSGYDLCTGWGTPKGAGLIDALSPEPLQVTPAAGFTSFGNFGGPFGTTNQTFVLTNIAPNAVNWSLINTSSWLTASSSGGTLTFGGTSATVNIGLNSSANSLAAGIHTGNVLLSNANDTVTQNLQFILEVLKITPTVSWSTPSAITYGTALSSSQLDATANVPGSFVYTPPNGTVLNARTNSLSTVFTPSNTADYSIVTNSVSLVVSPAPLSVTANNATREYGASNPVFTGTIAGLENGDNITASYSCSAVTNSPLGTYPIMPALVDPGNRRTNYIVSLTNGTLTVTTAPSVLSWAAPSAITYGTALGSNQLNATANVPGSFAYSPSNGVVLNTGTNLLSVLFTPSDMVDYTSASDGVNLVVAPAPLSVTTSNITRQYGASNPVFTGTITGVTNGDNITASYSCSAMTNSPVGTYSIVPSLVDPNDSETNYIVSLSNGTLTVTMAAPLLNWPAPSAITYGTVLSSNQLDATANLPGNFAYSPSNGVVLNTGTNILSVIFTPADMVDYSTASDGVSLVVSPVPLTVTAADASQVYGQTNPVFTGTITGLTNDDDITADYSCSATTNSPVGTYSIMPALVDPDDRETNYIVSLSNGTLTVTMAAPLLNWPAPGAINYGTALSSNQLDATANVPGSFAYAPAAGAELGPGTNTLSVLFTPTDMLDYSNAASNVSLVVSLAPITLNIQLISNAVVLSWNDPAAVFALQAACNITNVFTNIPGAATPYTNAIGCTQQYFRLTSN